MDYQYICEKVTISSGCITRFYSGGAIIAQHSLISLPIDPLAPYLPLINPEAKPIGIITTPLLQNIGYIAIGKDTLFTIGPTKPILTDPIKIEQELLIIGIEKAQHENYKDLLSTLACPTVNELTNKLAFFYHLLTGKTVTIEYILNETISLDVDGFFKQSDMKKARACYDTDKTAVVIKSYDFEVKLLSFIRFGQTDKLKDLFHNAFEVSAGELSKDILRQHKNLFICTATLAARTAIDGGLDCVSALQASDFFIGRAEALSSETAINYLLTEMLFFYTEKINMMNMGNIEHSPLIKRVFNYVANNLSHPLKVYDIAKQLNVDRAYLSTFFKQNCGISLSDYILKQKIQESKRLLLYSDIAISEIAYHLYFSSQSHFQNVFKKLEGVTPGQFKQKNKQPNQNTFS